MDYAIFLLNSLAIWFIFALATSFLLLCTGIVSICQGAIWGLGAYSFAILTTNFSVPPAVAVGGALVMGAIGGLFVSVIAGNAEHEFAVMATFAVQYLLIDTFHNAESLTNGPYGISGITVFVNQEIQAIVIFLLAALCCVLFFGLFRSKFASICLQSRQSAEFVMTAGYSPIVLRHVAFLVSGLFCGLSGGLFAAHIGYIAPSSFGIVSSVFVLSATLLGGVGTLLGSLAGALVIVGVPELLRFVGTGTKNSGNIDLIVFGALLMIIPFAGAGGAFANKTHKLILKMAR